MNRQFEKTAEMVLFLPALLSVILTLAIFVFMLVFGLPLMKGGRFFELITGSWSPGHGMYGIQPMIMGTMAIASLSVFFAFPLSMGCASLISVLAPRGFSTFLRHTVRLMTGVPTVIYGFVGIFLLVPIIRELFQNGSGFCILSASLMLALLISPTMILVFMESFDRVPKSYLDAADALGGTPVQKLVYVIIPQARQGIWMGVILSMGRSLGDTLIALMLAGNAIATPGSVLDSVRTLTAHIALVIASDYESLEFKSVFACGLILYGFNALIIVMLRYVESKGTQ
ncbi:PstC family ABC transporter permease [Desulfonema magnum]|uniref:Phosphate transport system, permease protein, PstC-like n=1 Tax=Desulfonema magnum TaxID=45655 RepID=A0A975BRY0_9BACT|nr:ABC transporter permease subunit [Desulfonema magnum]QTA90332.1 Phosphate transport system, permease protein, PstC-like [Desulfonema magnum]